ncbi:hypothetical protein WN71_023695 [Streptomyces mangrovisoli]|uniref:PH domain-containing protein n=1 Tax=Streptomyces mangrovisoli TaxID=1428628 RepID=A0A1J4NUU7_9ACTN|nr:hypothetical protein WN71_023695 [Streptomyces mangrovisoli]
MLLALGCTEAAPDAARPFLFGAWAVVWAWLTWRACTMRIRLSPDGIHSHGLWRTRFVAWDDLLMVVADHDLPMVGLLWECPTALLADGDRVVLNGVYGLVSEDTSRVDRITARLNTLLARPELRA